MRKRVGWLGSSLVAIVGLFTLLGFLADYAYLFDLAAHFRLQYVIVLIFCLVLFILLKKRELLWVSAVILAINLWPIAPYYWPNQTTSLTQLGAPAKVLLMNVLSSNTDGAAVRAQITRFKPDLLVLEEVTPRWFDDLSDLSEQYPYQIHEVREDNFGIWVLSKYLMEDEEIVAYGPTQLPAATFRCRIGRQLVQVIAMHPMSPGSPAGVRWRNEQLREIARRYKETDDPLLVVGDLNTTSFAPVFNELCRTLELKDSRYGFGLQCTWPGWSFNPLMIALDHCLVSEEVEVTHREVGDYVGSDHLPVYTEIRLPQ